MNGYNLSRNFWNWAFDNPEKISPNHSAIYFFAIEHCNRLGWKKKFGFPSQMTMDAIGIKKHSTYIRYFNDLVEFGFFELIQKSTNQYSSNIICLVNALPKKGEALDKAFVNHGEKQTRTMGKSKRSVYKQQTTKQETSKPYLEGGHLSISLEEFTKLSDQFGIDNATEYCHNVLNWAKNSKVKSLYLTSLKWMKRDNVRKDAEDRSGLSELELLEIHKEKVRKENGWT